MGLFSAFQKKLQPARIELLCQNTGETFQVNVHKSRHTITCRKCARESWVIDLKEGKGNITVDYVDAVGTHRKLDAIHAGTEHGLASVDATSGTFVIVSQE